MKKSSTAEIIAIGNELLIGHTLDTNSHWIAKHLTKQGWTLRRISIVRDSLAAIKAAVGEALQRRPNLLITLGGLGPTYDDMTLRGIAQALRRKLAVNPEALAMIKARYARIETTTGLTSFRKKMATLPIGAQPLPNPVGTAPGVLIKIRGTKLVSLPGVPSEMKVIFSGSIIPLLKGLDQHAPREAYLGLAGIIESALAPALDRTRKAFPGLYFKSHPRGRETGVRSLIQLHIYTTNGDSPAKLDDAIAHLLMELAKIPLLQKTRPEKD